jgi:hypothetical protein
MLNSPYLSGMSYLNAASNAAAAAAAANSPEKSLLIEKLSSTINSNLLSERIQTSP